MQIQHFLKMDVLIKSGSIHFIISLIVTEIVGCVIVFSFILVPTCRYSHVLIWHSGQVTKPVLTWSGV